ncbi:uncharacterized protein G2W53_018096 [Senna tora]|uniref:Uncharacterized protein n=1 Tax=Senna tora TaxID=362788 RepID=A0A834TT30_9FABA|nr:uncharacterized protein G2W53_018096 [Senna tora]
MGERMKKKMEGVARRKLKIQGKEEKYMMKKMKIDNGVRPKEETTIESLPP